MKKVLSMLLALAMVLTMAAFPAFAEEAQINVAAVTSAFTAGSGYSLLGVVDGIGVGDTGAANANYFRASVKITPSGTKGDAPNDANFHVVVDFAVPYNVTGLRANWGGKYATGIALWASNDNVNWTEIADLAPTTQTSENTVSHEGYYRYVKVEAYKILENNNDPACGELTFYGTMSPDYAKVTGMTVSDVTLNSDSYDKNTLIDGDTSNSTANSFIYGWSSTSKTFEVTLPETTTVSTLALYWGLTGGAVNGYNIRPAKTYDVFFAGEDGVYGEAAYSHDDTTLTGTPRGTNRNDIVVFDTPVEGVKKIKVVVSNYYASGNLAIREFEVFKYTKEVVKTPATYTVNYVDTEGEPIATPKTVDGKFVGNTVTEEAISVPGYKCTEAPKTITLVDGTNEIVFTYAVATNVTYTVNYVDTAGNPIADAKTVTAYEGDEVLEAAVTVAGYFLSEAEFAKTITLAVDGENEITFTYRKVLVPATVSATYAAGVSNTGGHASDWAKLYDGTVNATVQYAPVGESYVEGTSPIIVTYAFTDIIDFTTLATISNGNRASGVKIYTSMDGAEWTLVGTYEPRTTESTVVFTKADGSLTETTYLNTYDLTGFTGTQVKFEVTSSTLAWCGIYELMVDGAVKAPASTDADGVKPNSSWGWATGSMTKTDASVLFDGNPASNTEGYFTQGYFGESTQPEAGRYDLEIDLGALYDNPTITIQGGAPDWNYAHILAYEIYVAGIDGVYGEYPVSGVDFGTTITSANKVRSDLHEIVAEGVRYIKIVPKYVLRRTVLGEISVYATPVDLAANPDKAGAANGAQIRLPSGTVPAGIRFGATIAKDVFGDALTTGDYSYAELAAAGIKVGMFILPVDLLGGNATLADYITNGGEDALEVAAARVYAEDDFAVTFTAVLTEIPNTAYNREIVAVPYVYIDGEYTFYAEMTRTYAAVAESVATAYEAGEIALTEAQITLIEAVINRTLVAPEVAE